MEFLYKIYTIQSSGAIEFCWQILQVLTNRQLLVINLEKIVQVLGYTKKRTPIMLSWSSSSSTIYIFFFIIIQNYVVNYKMDKYK